MSSWNVSRVTDMDARFSQQQQDIMQMKAEYNEKIKTTGIFIRDSTMVSDYGMLLFGGQLEGQQQAT